MGAGLGLLAACQAPAPSANLTDGALRDPSLGLRGYQLNIPPSLTPVSGPAEGYPSWALRAAQASGENSDELILRDAVAFQDPQGHGIAFAALRANLPFVLMELTAEERSKLRDSILYTETWQTAPGHTLTRRTDRMGQHDVAYYIADSANYSQVRGLALGQSRDLYTVVAIGGPDQSGALLAAVRSVFENLDVPQ